MPTHLSKSLSELDEASFLTLGLQRKNIAKKLIELYRKANAGHIGSSLSCLEILALLFKIADSSRDQIVLSKGHAAGALYCVLDEMGELGVPLDDFYKDGTLLSAHPPCGKQLKRIPFGTGSLGHGAGIATGMAWSQKQLKTGGFTAVVVSEGDLNEGSTWEALLFASQHKLNNFYLIVDANGLQGLGQSSEILNLDPLPEKLRAFGFEVSEVKAGNSIEKLAAGMTNLTQLQSAKPRCLLARTVKGHGVDYMENRFEWHYLPMNQEQFENAREQVAKK